MSHLLVKQRLDELYLFCNSRQWVHPDPLEFLYRYPDLEDREVAGFIAASLAYGRVAQILKSVSGVLDALGPSPSTLLASASDRFLQDAFSEFRHRFTSGDEMVLFLQGIRRVVLCYGSLGACFRKMYQTRDDTVLQALTAFVNELALPFGDRAHSLLARPQKGSACKRLNLFLRWMVREDNVDPGGWHWVPRSKLIIPLDTHMHRIAMVLGFTESRCASMATAIHITQAFREFAPDDPVRYDFALTRTGIRQDIPGFC